MLALLGHQFSEQSAPGSVAGQRPGSGGRFASRGIAVTSSAAARAEGERARGAVPAGRRARCLGRGCPGFRRQGTGASWGNKRAATGRPWGVPPRAERER